MTNIKVIIKDTMSKLNELLSLDASVFNDVHAVMFKSQGKMRVKKHCTIVYCC